MLEVAAVAPHSANDLQPHLVDAAASHEQAMAVEIKKQQNATGSIAGSEQS